MFAVLTFKWHCKISHYLVGKLLSYVNMHFLTSYSSINYHLCMYFSKGLVICLSVTPINLHIFTCIFPCPTPLHLHTGSITCLIILRQDSRAPWKTLPLNINAIRQVSLLNCKYTMWKLLCLLCCLLVSVTFGFTRCVCLCVCVCIMCITLSGGGGWDRWCISCGRKG